MEELYKSLKALTLNDDTPFYSSIQVFGDEVYEIFSYHFTDRDSWLLPGALESRGTMFQIDRSGAAMRIASRPMHKFFNYSAVTKTGEVDFIDYGEPAWAMEKADGSLISTFLDASGQLQLKSKGSLYSDHAVGAQAYLNQTDKAWLKTFLCTMEDDGFTVNMEWVSPDPLYRIVLHYPEPRLIILNARDRETGRYYNQEALKVRMPEDTVEVLEPEVIDDLQCQTGIEGYVVVDTNGNWFKCKTPWYLERHRAKDFINQPDAFVKLVLKDEADDVFALMVDQPELHKEMLDVQHKIITKANRYVNDVTKFYKDNSTLNRKDFAIKGQQELNGFEFPLAMKYYTTGTEPNWHEFLLNVSKKINWGMK